MCLFCRESFSINIDNPCTKQIKGTNHRLRKIRLSNRYDNQTRVTVCLKGHSSSSLENVSTCRKNIIVKHHKNRQALPDQPRIPIINVMNIPQPIEDVSFWENIVRLVIRNPHIYKYYIHLFMQKFIKIALGLTIVDCLLQLIGYQDMVRRILKLAIKSHRCYQAMFRYFCFLSYL